MMIKVKLPFVPSTIPKEVDAAVSKDKERAIFFDNNNKFRTLKKGQFEIINKDESKDDS